MPALDFRLAALLALMALLAILEGRIPLRPAGRSAPRRWAPNLLLTAVFLAMNVLLTALAVHAARPFAGSGLLDGLPLPLAWIAGIALLDLCAYAAHVLMHKVPFLWRVHRVHHSDEFVDVTTAFRQHPLETLLRFAFTFVPAVMAGVPPAATATYRLLSGINALLEHANIRVPTRLDRWLNPVVVTPDMHKIHHSRDQVQTDSNYGNILSAYDRMFRTFRPTAQAAGVVYGLDVSGDAHRSFAGLLRLPWTKVEKLPLPLGAAP